MPKSLQKRPTKRQSDTIQAIRRLTEKHGFGPTVREIAKALGVNHRAVAEHLDALEAQGQITRRRGTARSIQIVNGLRHPKRRGKRS